MVKRALSRLAILCGLFFAAITSTNLFSGDTYTLHTFKKIKLTDHYYSEGASFGDFNRDGVKDVVSGPYWYEGPDFGKKHEYYTAKEFPKEQGYADRFFSFIHDFNRDGWDDIFAVGFPSRNSYWYENPRKTAEEGKVLHWKKHPAAPAVGNESPTLADLTGDGRPELIYNTEGYLGYAQPNWGNVSAPWDYIAIAPKEGWHHFTHGLGVGDVNGDGRMDVLMTNAWWEQPASLEGNPVWKKHAFEFAGNAAQMYAYDVDGDGDNDIVTALQAHGYGLAWYEHVKTGAGAISFKRHRIMSNRADTNPYGVRFSQLHAVNLIDIDGDGLKDILTGKCRWAHGPRGDPDPNADPVIYWFKLVREAGGEGRDKVKVRWIPYRIDDDSGVGRQVVAGDISGDGLVDVVIGNKKGAYVFLQAKKSVTKEEWEKAQPRRIRGFGGD